MLDIIYQWNIEEIKSNLYFSNGNMLSFLMQINSIIMRSMYRKLRLFYFPVYLCVLSIAQKKPQAINDVN